MRAIHFILFLIALGLLAGELPSSAMAQDNYQIRPHYRPSFDQCWKRAGKSESRKIACIDDETLYQRKILEEYYAKIYPTLDDKDKEIYDRQKNIELPAAINRCMNPSILKIKLADQKFCVLYRIGLQAEELAIDVRLAEEAGK